MRAFIIIISLTLSNVLQARQVASSMTLFLLTLHYFAENSVTTANTFDFYKPTNDCINIQDTVYHFKVRLTKALPRTPDCGYIAFALVQKFEVISTDFPNYKDRFILLIQPCPEFLGENFFKTDNIYNVDASKTSGETISFTYTNTYDKEKLPILWSRKILKTN